MAKFQWVGFERIFGGLALLKDPDARPLMEDWERRIVADNRRGILQDRTDKHGTPLAKVTYRPLKNTPAKPWTKRQQAAAVGTNNNNLTSAQYRRLAGPPLAPRGAMSRVITNLYTGHGRMPARAIPAGSRSGPGPTSSRRRASPSCRRSSSSGRLTASGRRA